MPENIKKILVAPAGEALVTYQLSKEGWFVINANGGVNNMPNFDLMAMNDKQQIVSIQVKSSTTNDANVGSMTGKKIKTINDREGAPKADIVAFVKLCENDDEIRYVSAEKIIPIIRKYACAYGPKRKKTFPLNIPVWGDGKRLKLDARKKAWKDIDKLKKRNINQLSEFFR